MCSTHSQALLPAYLLFLIHDVQEPERLSSKEAFQPQELFLGFPSFFEMSII